MTAALDSGLSLDSIYTYSPALKSSSALPHQPLQLPRHDQHEISWLALRTDDRCNINFLNVNKLYKGLGEKISLFEGGRMINLNDCVIVASDKNFLLKGWRSPELGKISFLR